ncbi:MAG: glycosyltransferase [Lachnospiraceae bacterium]|nr:glycosyltransferase [Lachnospiraceae bacterium]
MGQKRKIRILQINKLYYPYTGGVEYVVRQIAEGLCQSTDMKVLVCSEKSKTIQERVNGVLVTRAGSWMMLGNLPISLKVFSEFRRQAKDRDILFFHMPFPIGDLVYFLSGIRDKKIIVWWHSDIVRQKKWMVLYRPLMEWFLRKADRILVATKGHIEGSQYLKAYQNKCRIIPFGLRKEIEEDSYQYFYREKPQLEQEGNRKIQESKRVRFLFVGRLVYYKGCDVLIEAWRGLEQAELIIVGNGSLKQKIRKYAEQEALSGQICFKENLSDRQVMEEYRKCDVLVLPSIAKSEAFGLVQIEAMAYGKPVINTWLPSGVPYVSLHQITGLTVKPGNQYALHRAMEWMILHPKERKQMGEAARKRVEEEFSMKKMIHQIREVCQELL